MLVGGSELPPSDENSNIRASSSSPLASPTHKSRSKGWLSYLPPELQVLVQQWRQGPHHRLCRHKHSCIASVVEVSNGIKVCSYLAVAYEICNVMIIMFSV